MNLRLMLEETANQYPEKTAIVMGKRRVSYAELDEASNKIANALLKNGVRKGDRVAMLLLSSPEFIIIYLGIVKIGGIAVPLDTRYKIGELASILDNFQPKILVAESPFLEPLVPALPQFKTITHIIDMTSSYNDKFLSYQDIMATSPAQKVKVELNPEDIASLAYTSAPTLHPQGAMFSHRTLLDATKIISDGLQLTDKDTIMLFALPLHHMIGLTIVLIPSLSKGSTLVIVPGTGISIGSLMEAIEAEKGTILIGVPYIFDLAVKLAEREGIRNDLSSLRLCCAGGAPVSTRVIRQFKHHYGFPLSDIWGLTEAVSQVTYQPADSKIKMGSSGKALPGWEIRIVDDNARVLPPNQAGEIIIRGPITEGYYNNPQATAEAIRNGWLYTGDIGKMDKDGYLFLTGRKKSLIILKGQNIYPSDIEEVLCTHPKIAEVKIVGVPDKLRGEIVRAFIVLKEGEVVTEQEIKQFCQKHMADYKSPRQIIFTKSLPQTAAAGVQAKSLSSYLAKLTSLIRLSYRGKPKP